jgi:3-oxoacyl-[acyl-carrier-protein] synthase II
MDTALVLGKAGATRVPAPSPHRVVVTGIAVATPHGILNDEAVAEVPSLTTNATEIALGADALDAERARRLDRASRLATVVTERALGPGDRKGAGIILGIAFGAVDGCAEFMRRLQEKGARMVRPADFPGLVPSSPAGHVSIYLGLTGPTLVVADLAASGEAAVVQAHELVAAGDADRLCAGAVEERSEIVEQVLSVVFADERGRGTGHEPRREGAAAIALARERPGLPALARLGETFAWIDRGRAMPAELAALAVPPSGALVVLGHQSTRASEIVDGTTWRDVPRVVCAGACGAHEAAGAIAAAVACAKVARGDAAAALFVGSARGAGYAGTVWPVERRP